MAVNFQVVVDCADPHRLAAFWSAALGWKAEEHEDFIKKLLADGLVSDDEVTEVDGRLEFRDYAAIRDPEAQVNARQQPVRGRMLFQVVLEGKTVKNHV